MRAAGISDDCHFASDMILHLDKNGRFLSTGRIYLNTARWCSLLLKGFEFAQFVQL